MVIWAIALILGYDIMIVIDSVMFNGDLFFNFVVKAGTAPDGSKSLAVIYLLLPVFAALLLVVTSALRPIFKKKG